MQKLRRGGFLPGPGGSGDYARGAKAAGGLRIIALPSEAGGASRIIPAGGGHGPVSLSRFDARCGRHRTWRGGSAQSGARGARARADRHRRADTRETSARHWRDAMQALQET